MAGFWSATEMRLNIGSEHYNVYIANNVSMVQKMHKDHQVKRLSFLGNLSYQNCHQTISSSIIIEILFDRQRGFTVACHGKRKP